MENSLKLVGIVVLMGLLANCADKGPAEPDYTDALAGAALESAAAKDYWAADYFTPLVAQRYGLRTFEVTVGEPEEFTSSIVGTHTVPYQTGAMTGTIVWFWNEPLLFHVDGRSLYWLNDDEYYLSTDCDLTDFPSERVIGRVIDGMILDQRGDVWRVHPSDPDDCIPGTEDSGVWLIQIRDVYVGGKKYSDAMLMWDLAPGSEHNTLDFHGKDEELGITGPSSDETNGWAVDGWVIVGFRQGIIAVGDFSVGSGELGEFAELVSIEPLEPLAAAACPTEADFVVSDEDELHDAVDQAKPGDVIALDGFFEVTDEVVVDVDQLTLTCATPGSGLYGDGDFFDLVWIAGDGVRVEHLKFEAGAELSAAIFAGWAEGGDYPVVANNTFQCRSATCVWFNRSVAPTIVNNHLDISTADVVVSAIQIQQWTTHSHVEGNTIIGPIDEGRSGIRIRSGSNHQVIGNKVSGPWNESISARGSSPSENQFIRNRLEGATGFGLDLWGEVCDFIVEDIDTGEIEWECHIFEPAMGNVVRNNRISGAGAGGIIVSSACWNTIVGNNLQGNADDIGIRFFGVETLDFVEENLHYFGTQDGTGANTFVGNGNIVIDDVNLDCDGDGEPDPNIINGASAVQQGVNLGRVVGEAMSSKNDVDDLTLH